MKVRIGSAELGLPSGYLDYTEPSWLDIESAIQKLADDSGRLDLFSDTEDDEQITTITIRSDSSLYLVEVFTPNASKVLVDSTAEDSTEIVGMCDGECRRGLAVDSSDAVIKMLRVYLESGEFSESAPFYWSSACQ